MCFNARFRIKIALRRAEHNNPEEAEYWRNVLRQYDDWFQISGFSHPDVIIYANEKPFTPKVSKWGLIPKWAKDPGSIWNSTLNARGETIFEKPAFRESAVHRRCLIPAEGYYDYHHFKDKAYPFYIKLKKQKPMHLAGLWNDWTNPVTGEIINTFTIVTTRANRLMSKIHNKPKLTDDPRMLAILPEVLAEEWLKPLSRKEVEELVQPYPDSEMEAYTVRSIAGKNSPGNVPEANEKYHYNDLVFDWEEDEKRMLF
jgi:putative SOS response-associated peptidase YedK